MAWEQPRPTTWTNRRPGNGRNSDPRISDPQDISTHDPWQGRLGDPVVLPAGIRPGYRHLQWIYCTWRDDELVALRLEAMTLPELVEVSSKLLARGPHEGVAELLVWIGRCALSRRGAP